MWTGTRNGSDDDISNGVLVLSEYEFMDFFLVFLAECMCVKT